MLGYDRVWCNGGMIDSSTYGQSISILYPSPIVGTNKVMGGEEVSAVGIDVGHVGR